MPRKIPAEHWKDEPDKHDYDAAEDYLSLLMLAPENTHVVDDLKKVKAGKQLSPVLIVRGQLRAAVPLTIADGYHRVCASYHLDEDADIPCRVADMARA